MLGASCGGAANGDGDGASVAGAEVERIEVPPEEAEAVAGSLIAFGWDLYRDLAGR